MTTTAETTSEHTSEQQPEGAATAPPDREEHGASARNWMRSNLTTQGLLAAGATTIALVLGGLLAAACATVTATNLRLPSAALAWWERHTTRKDVIAA